MTPRCRECRFGVNGDNSCPVEIVQPQSVSCDRYLAVRSVVLE